MWHKPAGTARFWIYRLEEKTWQEAGPTTAVSGGAGIAYLPGHDVIIWFNASLPKRFAVYDIQTGQVQTNPQFSGQWVGDGPRASALPQYVAPDDCVAWWDQSSQTDVINYMKVPADPMNGVWSIGQFATGGVKPSARAERGTYGRFQYVPRLDGFVLLNGINEPLYFYARR
jgi:hypothetical protein